MCVCMCHENIWYMTMENRICQLSRITNFLDHLMDFSTKVRLLVNIHIYIYTLCYIIWIVKKTIQTWTFKNLFYFWIKNICCFHISWVVLLFKRNTLEFRDVNFHNLTLYFSLIIFLLGIFSTIYLYFSKIIYLAKTSIISWINWHGLFFFQFAK